jgi:DNA-binding response OmpR family regulator
MDKRQHIVVVEDEPAQRQLLLDYLTAATASQVSTGQRPAPDGRARAAGPCCSMSVCREDGFAIARWLREKSGKVCIIMVTAAGDTVDRVVGPKPALTTTSPSRRPASPARIKSCASRRRGDDQRRPARMGRRVLDLDKRVPVDADGARRRQRPANSIS